MTTLSIFALCEKRKTGKMRLWGRIFKHLFRLLLKKTRKMEVNRFIQALNKQMEFQFQLLSKLQTINSRRKTAHKQSCKSLEYFTTNLCFAYKTNDINQNCCYNQTSNAFSKLFEPHIFQEFSLHFTTDKSSLEGGISGDAATSSKKRSLAHLSCHKKLAFDP